MASRRHLAKYQERNRTTGWTSMGCSRLQEPERLRDDLSHNEEAYIAGRRKKRLKRQTLNLELNIVGGRSQQIQMIQTPGESIGSLVCSGEAQSLGNESLDASPGFGTRCIN